MFRNFIRLTDLSDQQYLDNLENKKKKLKPAAAEFIDKFLTKVDYVNEYGNDDNESLLIVDSRDKLEQLGNQAKVEDLFPKEVYPALDLLMGERFRVLFIQSCQHMVGNIPYTVGYYRKPLRSKSMSYYFDIIFALFSNLIEYHMLGIDAIKLVKKEYEKSDYFFHDNPHYIAAEINDGNVQLISTIKDIINAENNNAIITYPLLKSIFISDNDELVELVSRLLLAAKLQEGLRQSICETMDCGLYKNFCYMFKIIYDNNLLRFSSVKRALGTWTGIGEDYSDRLSKKQMEIIHQLIVEPAYADELLESEDNVELFLALWAKGSVDVDSALEHMMQIAKAGKKHNQLLASYFLEFTQSDTIKMELSKQMLQLYPEDEDVLACFGNYILPWRYNIYSLKSLVGTNTLDSANYFACEEEAVKLFDILENFLNSMNTKQITISPCIFPWYSASISKSDIAKNLVYISAILKQEALYDRLMDYIKFISYGRHTVLKLLYSKPRNKKQRNFVVSMLSDRSDACDAAYEIVKDNEMTSEYRIEIEALFRLKTENIRLNALKLLYSLPENELISSIENLIVQKDENKRLAALTLIADAKSENKFDGSGFEPALQNIKKPSSKEMILIEKIMGGSNSDIALPYDTNYFHEFDLQINEPVQSKFKAKVNKAPFKSIYINNSISIKQIFPNSHEQNEKIFKKLSALVEKHADYEYKDKYGRESLIGDNISVMQKNEKNEDDEYITGDYIVENLPLSEIWQKFYADEINDFAVLFQLRALNAVAKKNSYSFSHEEGYVDVVNDIMGFDIYEMANQLFNIDIKYKKQVSSILHTIYNSHKRKNLEYVLNASKAVICEIYKKMDLSKMVQNSNYYNEDHGNIINTVDFLSELNTNLRYYSNDAEFIESYALKHKIRKKFWDYAKEQGFKVSTSFISVAENAKAVTLGLVPLDEFYTQAIMHNYDYISILSDYIYGSRYKYKRVVDSFEENAQSKELLKTHGLIIIDHIIDLELKRGDTPTPFSGSVLNIRKILGIDRLISILLALGNDKLDRNSYYYYRSSAVAERKTTLSHMLKVCYPAPDDDIKKFKSAMKEANISDKRLIDVAMYCPQWIEMIEKYLGWKGLESGCFYFQAHTSDLDEKLEGVIGKYTPISIEDLKVGAFDVDWFKSAHKELGDERFELLYDSAKYISDGAKHSRARMFADATLGKLDLEESEAKISDKRNQNLVMSYSLIPLGKNRDAQILKRYKFLQNFLVESKQFGAQRRASEAKAVEISLENLARNAGFSDVTRLTCSMETKLISEFDSFFKPHTVGDISAHIAIDEFGQANIIYEKAGKALKSLPAKYRKDEYILELKEVHKNLKNQYTRSKKMLETSMEDEVEFYVSEISELMNNPILAPLLEKLIFKSGDQLGFFESGHLVDYSGKKHKLKPKETIKIAHSLDLFHDKHWAQYQKHLFDKQIKQPFKQVFRELYVKTKDELGKDHSLRYAGHQVQPKKTIAMLKSRRWIIDGEEGLQKVYYKQNIIAKIYALADWFSPADIEAPTLEWVCFYNRKDYKEIKIDDVPDLIFTEVMRDVDLAVSIAHVGGVDPETSHSTIEMRKAIMKLNLDLFKLKNVSFTDNFAIIEGSRANYSIHLGSGLVHQKAGSVINVLPVHSQHRGRIFLPFIDEDPKSAEIMSKIVLFAQDEKIKDPFILEQIV